MDRTIREFERMRLRNLLNERCLNSVDARCTNNAANQIADEYTCRRFVIGSSVNLNGRYSKGTRFWLFFFKNTNMCLLYLVDLGGLLYPQEIEILRRIWHHVCIFRDVSSHDSKRFPHRSSKNTMQNTMHHTCANQEHIHRCVRCMCNRFSGI